MRLNTMKLSSVLIMLLIYTKSNKEPQLQLVGGHLIVIFLCIIIVVVAMTLMGVHLMFCFFA